MAALTGPQKDKIMWSVVAIGVVIVIFAFGMTEGTFR